MCWLFCVKSLILRRSFSIFLIAYQKGIPLLDEATIIMIKHSQIAFYIVIFISFFLEGSVSFAIPQQKYFTSQKQRLDSSKITHKVLKMQKSFEKELYQNPKNASKTAEQLLNYLPELSKNKELETIILLIQSEKHAYITQNHDSTIFWVQKVMPNLNHNADSVLFIQTYRSLATSFFHKNELDSASFFYIKATKIAEALNSEKYLIKLYNNLATIYSLFAKNETARKYYLKGLELARKRGNKMEQIKNMTKLCHLSKIFLVVIFYFLLKKCYYCVSNCFLTLLTFK